MTVQETVKRTYLHVLVNTDGARSVIIVDWNRPKAEMINESEIVKELETDEHIRYFKLPQDNGWNSGRALLISQVQTEYFVTCDGDFFFNEGTRIGNSDQKTRAPPSVSLSTY